MRLRDSNLEKLGQGEKPFDVLILGGGINGAVSAAALSARGARVALLDRGDFASVTSQSSSNLAWGGIKYMETFEFALVRKLCRARNQLIRAYPSTVQEIRFYASHERGFRHGLWKLLLGTWLYWLIGGGFTKRPRLLGKKEMAAEEPIIELSQLDGGFEYSDAYLHDNDARFVFGFVRSALNYGCVAVNYVESLGSIQQNGLWVTRARDVMSGRELVIRSKVLINACGPFADAVNDQLGAKTRHKHLLSKGIHIIVRRLTPHARVLTFFADDGRLFFVIPMGPRTVIGTTDTRVDSALVEVTPEDRKFVLDNINKRLRLPQPLTEQDIIAERCGVRPLVVDRGAGGLGKDWMQLSRKHVIERSPGQLTIFGGKLTDCLNVGEEICGEMAALGVALPFPRQKWFGEAPKDVRDDYFHQARLMNLDALTSPTASEKLSSRLWRRYGSGALGLLEQIRADPRRAELLIENAEYLRCEIEQTAEREMVTRLEDFLRRRSKIALVVRRGELARSAGLREACQILFGDQAEERFAEYFA